MTKKPSNTNSFDPKSRVLAMIASDPDLVLIERYPHPSRILLHPGKLIEEWVLLSDAIKAEETNPATSNQGWLYGEGITWRPYWEYTYTLLQKVIDWVDPAPTNLIDQLRKSNYSATFGWEPVTDNEGNVLIFYSEREAINAAKEMMTTNTNQFGTIAHDGAFVRIIRSDSADN